MQVINSLTRLERLKELNYLLSNEGSVAVDTQGKDICELLSERYKLESELMAPVDFKDKNSLSQDEDKPYEENDAIFDGERLKRKLANFLQRINHALNEAQQHLPDFEILNIEVTSSVNINGEVSFPSGGGIGAGKSRAITFQLRPKVK